MASTCRRRPPTARHPTPPWCTCARRSWRTPGGCSRAPSPSRCARRCCGGREGSCVPTLTCPLRCVAPAGALLGFHALVLPLCRYSIVQGNTGRLVVGFLRSCVCAGPQHALPLGLGPPGTRNCAARRAPDARARAAAARCATRRCGGRPRRARASARCRCWTTRTRPPTCCRWSPRATRSSSWRAPGAGMRERAACTALP